MGDEEEVGEVEKEVVMEEEEAEEEEERLRRGWLNIALAYMT